MEDHSLACSAPRDSPSNTRLTLTAQRPQPRAIGKEKRPSITDNRFNLPSSGNF